MKKLIWLALLLVCAALEGTDIDSKLQASFTPPQGWRYADPDLLPKHIKVMIVGQGGGEMPPSMNLGYEEFKGTLKEYLKIVKSINDSQGDTWKDLGSIQTEAGSASLSQLDSKTKWGLLRHMHVIFLQDGIAYILTASALKEEFSQFYPAFFQALRSFRIEKEMTR